jgi:hypothetical protein
MKNARFGRCCSCLLAAVVLSAIGSTAGADTVLRWKFTAGQKREYVMVQKMAMKQEVMGRQIETTLTQTMEMTWEVKSVDKDGVADMVQTIDRIKLSMTAPPPIGNIDLDTTKADDAAAVPAVIKPMIDLFRAISGSPFSSKITPRGELRDVKVPKKIVDAVQAAGPGGAMFNEDSLKDMFGQSMIVFPEAAVAPGKSWTGTRKVAMQFGTSIADMTYTLDGATGPVQNIGIDAKVKIEPQPGTPFAIAVKNQEMKGSCRFDNAAGSLTASDMVQKMSMTLTIMGQEIGQEIEQTVKLDLKGAGTGK